VPEGFSFHPNHELGGLDRQILQFMYVCPCECMRTHSYREFVPFEATSSWAWSIDSTIYVINYFVEFKNTRAMLDSA
jgi:hypothetical protein